MSDVTVYFKSADSSEELEISDVNKIEATISGWVTFYFNDKVLAVFNVEYLIGWTCDEVDDESEDKGVKLTQE